MFKNFATVTKVKFCLFASHKFQYNFVLNQLCNAPLEVDLLQNESNAYKLRTFSLERKTSREVLKNPKVVWKFVKWKCQYSMKPRIVDNIYKFIQLLLVDELPPTRGAVGNNVLKSFLPCVLTDLTTSDTFSWTYLMTILKWSQSNLKPIQES